MEEKEGDDIEEGQSPWYISCPEVKRFYFSFSKRFTVLCVDF